MRSKIALSVAILIATAAPAFALRVSEEHFLGEARWPDRPESMAVTSLTSGGYVAAWTPSDGSGVRARIIDENGDVAGADVTCRSGGWNDETRSAALATVSDGFVLGCELVHHQSLPWFSVHMRRFTPAGSQIGPPIDLDTPLATQLLDLVTSSGSTFLATLVRCESTTCELPNAVFDSDHEIVSEFNSGRLDAGAEIVALSGGRFLAVGMGPAGSRGFVTLRARRLSADGRRIGKVAKLARLQTPNSIVRLVTGVAGRIGLTWSTVHDGDVWTVYVRLFNAAGEVQGENMSFELPFEGWANIPVAMPLEQGFVLSWTAEEDAPEQPNGSVQRTFLQQYTNNGQAVGGRLVLSPDVASVAEVAFVESDNAFILGGLYYGNPTSVGVWRVGLESACGDVNRDSDVTTSDAQTIVRAASGQQACELCRCDLDNSGTIDAADAAIALRVATGQEYVSDCPICPE